MAEKREKDRKNMYSDQWDEDAGYEHDKDADAGREDCCENQ